MEKLQSTRLGGDFTLNESSANISGRVFITGQAICMFPVGRKLVQSTFRNYFDLRTSVVHNDSRNEAISLRVINVDGSTASGDDTSLARRQCIFQLLCVIKTEKCRRAVRLV